MEPRIFPSKILLFGEYVILLQAKALVMPFSHFSASLQFTGSDNLSKDHKAEFSNEVLRKFYQFISKLPEQTDLKYKFDLKRFQSDIGQGLYIDSTIPVGYGLGSSGAVTAAIFDQYCLRREDVSIDEGYLLHLKKRLSVLESFFHFNSSGIDPLVCYCNKPLLYKENKVELLNFSLNQMKCYQVALIDTGMPHKAHNLVEQFINNCMDETYLTSIKKNMIIPSNNCIDALLEGNSGKFFRNLSDLSASQYIYFRPMIIPSLEEFWKQSFQTDDFALKLCGSGGGGYLLAFVKNYDAFGDVLKQYNLSALEVG
jgi:mevalonate kinase